MATPTCRKLDDGLPESSLDASTVTVESLLKAAWMRFNGENLINRKLRPDGRIDYMFSRSDNTDQLMREWDEKAPKQYSMIKYARLVSFEIRRAVRMRREVGLRRRVEGFDSEIGSG